MMENVSIATWKETMMTTSLNVILMATTSVRTEKGESDMGAITRDEVREILEEIIKEQSQKNTAENTDETQSEGE